MATIAHLSDVHFGAHAPKIVDGALKARMRSILAEVRAGRFTEALSDEEAKGYPLLDQARRNARASALEAARRRLGGGQT